MRNLPTSGLVRGAVRKALRAVPADGEPSARDFAELRDWLNAPEILRRFPPERYYALCDALDLAEAVRWCEEHCAAVDFVAGGATCVTVWLERPCSPSGFLRFREMGRSLPAAVAALRKRMEGKGATG